MYLLWDTFFICKLNKYCCRNLFVGLDTGSIEEFTLSPDYNRFFVNSLTLHILFLSFII